MSIVHVTWQGWDGSFWILDGHDSSGGVMLTKVNGMVSEVARATVPLSSGIGVSVSATTYPAMEGTLEFAITADAHTEMTKGEVYRAFTDSWRTNMPGVLTVVDSLAGSYSINCFAKHSVPVTEFSPWSKEKKFIEFSIDVFSTDGIYPGDEMVYSGSVVNIANRGDIATFPVIRWSGAGRNIVLPVVGSVALPTAPGGSYFRMSTDPSKGFVVTDDVGVVNSLAWSQMRGRPVLGRIEPGEVATFTLSAGVTLLVRQFLENPWR